MRYIIDYGFGRAVLYTPHDPEERFYRLAATCFGIRKSIAGCRIVHVSEAATPEGGYERLEFNGDVYVWREDGARKMLKPDLDEEWDTDYCEECRAAESTVEDAPNERDICVDALNTWGGDAQTLMMFEEMTELQKELCKHARGAENRLAIAEEIADVRIMLDQMAIFHGCEEEAYKFEADKLARLRKRIEEARAGDGQ